MIPMKCETHDFYCINCGRKGIPVMRKCNHLHAKDHRKKLYCPWCKAEINHVECRSFYDIEKFKEDFANGLYRQEAEESLRYARMSNLMKPAWSF